MRHFSRKSHLVEWCITVVRPAGRQLIISLLIIGCIITPIPAQAQTTETKCPEGMTQEDCEAILLGWANWVPDDGSSICAYVQVDPKAVGRGVFDFFVAKGYEPFQAAAIIGNMQVESGLQPQRLEGTSSGKVTTAEEYMSKFGPEGSEPSKSPGWGLVQWTPGEKFITTQTPISKANDPTVQTDFLWQQLEGKTSIPEKNAGTMLKASKTIEEAVFAFEFGYERPADPFASLPLRVGFAKEALMAYGSGTSSAVAAAVSDSCGTASGGSTVDGKYALPVPQKIFDQHPEYFSKPHHDYPSADIPYARGTAVYASLTGKVIIAPATKFDSCYGRGVVVQSGDIYIIYGHGYDGGSVPGAKEGDTVQAGQLIMHGDSEGCSTGDHLHFDLRVGANQASKRVCPQTWLTAVGKKQTPPDIRTLPKSGCSY